MNDFKTNYVTPLQYHKKKFKNYNKKIKIKEVLNPI